MTRFSYQQTILFLNLGMENTKIRMRSYNTGDEIMTIEQQAMLKREMDDALAITEPDRKADAVQTVMLHYLYALTDCQRKTADRVKRIDAEREAAKQKIKGAQLLWKILRYVASAGGGGLIVHFLMK